MPGIFALLLSCWILVDGEIPYIDRFFPVDDISTDIHIGESEKEVIPVSVIPISEVPRILVIQIIPNSATVYIEFPPRQNDLENITAKVSGKSLILHFNDFSETIDFEKSVYVNYTEFKSRELTIDITLED